MSIRKFGVMKIRGSRTNRFLTRHTQFQQKIDPEIDEISSALSVCDPNLTLDDYLYNNLGVSIFGVDWEVRTYGDGKVSGAPESDLRVFCEAYASGSAELKNIIDGSISLHHSGRSVLLNPYYDPTENYEDEYDEEE